MFVDFWSVGSVKSGMTGRMLRGGGSIYKNCILFLSRMD